MACIIRRSVGCSSRDSRPFSPVPMQVMPRSSCGTPAAGKRSGRWRGTRLGAGGSSGVEARKGGCRRGRGSGNQGMRGAHGVLCLWARREQGGRVLWFLDGTGKCLSATPAHPPPPLFLPQMGASWCPARWSPTRPSSCGTRPTEGAGDQHRPTGSRRHFLGGA